MVVRHSLLGKVMAVVIISELLLAAFVANIGYFLYREKAIAKYTSVAYGLTDAASIVLDGDRMMTYLQEGREAEGYVETEKKLYAIRDGFPTAKYMYVYHIEEDGCHVVFDLMPADGEEPSQPGDLIPFDQSFEKYLPSLLKGDTIEPVISDDSYGWLLTVYKPLKDSSGTTVAYVAADISMESIVMDEISFLIKELSLFFGVSLVIMCLVTEVMKRRIVIPVNRMSQVANSFAHNSEAGRKISMRRVKALNIRSDDEIQNLYKAFSTMAEDFLLYIIQINAQNERITRMQDEIIINFAELVEARDEGTGNHIKKTAAYVEAIARQLKKEGVYSDVLTEDYITRLKRSAPLHDIGKIAISDLILNKPGKLTDEEFTLMKTHTTAGSEIVQRVIETVPEAGYLDTAKELAEYHHEKWNGFGYPHGISGDEIPLSARIMAVADVFDALVSKRSYKEGMPVEKAFGIIEEGIGTHFDPYVARAFLNAREEVLKVLNE
jgi:HD-GYP domain-containing protein (c-di-GMP phosphodiesterase class II)